LRRMTFALGNWRHRARPGCRSREPRNLHDSGARPLSTIKNQYHRCVVGCSTIRSESTGTRVRARTRLGIYPQGCWAVIASGDAIPPRLPRPKAPRRLAPRRIRTRSSHHTRENVWSSAPFSRPTRTPSSSTFKAATSVGFSLPYTPKILRPVSRAKLPT